MRGFTLMELVVVLLIVGILSGLAVSRFISPAQFDDLAFARELATAARHAQKLAVNSGCPVRLELSSTQYALMQPDTFCSTTFTRSAQKPGDSGAYAVEVPDGLIFSTSAGLPLTITFDAQGGTNLGADLSITAGSRTLTLHRVSGLLQVGA